MIKLGDLIIKFSQLKNEVAQLNHKSVIIWYKTAYTYILYIYILPHQMKKLFTYHPTFAQGLALGLCYFFFVFGWHVISIASTGSDETLRWFEFWTVKRTFPAGEIWDTDMVYMIHYFSKRSWKHYFSKLLRKIHISWHMWLLLMLQHIRM